jgi:hypothetical protein
MMVVERLTRSQIHFHPGLIQSEQGRCSVDSS